MSEVEIKSPLQGLLNFVLVQQPDNIRQALIKAAVLTWFNSEVLQAVSSETWTEKDEKYLFDVVKKLGLAQPYQDIGYCFHEEIRKTLLIYLAEDPDRELTIYGQVVNYLRDQIPKTSEKLRQNLLRRELANGLNSLGQLYLNVKDTNAAVTCFKEAAEVHIRLENATQAENLLLEICETLVDSRSWKEAHIVFEKLLNPDTFNGMPVDEKIQTRVAEWYRKEAEWYIGQRNWLEARNAYTEAIRLYETLGNTVELNKVYSDIESCIQNEKNSDSEINLLRKLLKSSRLDIENTTQQETDVSSIEPARLEAEMKKIEENMRRAWASGITEK